ncbi:S8/S53 family peptidase [Bacteroidota bacterium]
MSANIIYAQTNIISKGNKKYLAGEIIVKFSSDQTAKRLNKYALPQNINESLDKLGVKEIKKLFNIADNLNGEAAENIRNIFTLSINSSDDPEELSKKIGLLPGIEWAEPNFVREIFYDPNDTLYTNNEDLQWGLYKINAAEAWDISTGDTNVVIAIVDTGIYWDHPDLRENIWQNLGEDYDEDGRTIEFDGEKWVLDPGDINGKDDDDFDNDPDTFIDDLVGWDFQGWDGTPDNNPAEDSPRHGTHVAGIASAVTDNVYGIASIGFNCELMAVKSSQHTLGDDVIVNGHKGIAYAAAQGASVINCSWGGTGYSLAEKAAVDFAIEMGALVVCSAGNNGNELKNFPASYDGVLSVGYTRVTDIRNSSSNFGTTVDVMAPGTSTYSTWDIDSFGSKSGSSMASPLVAGLAGLVYSHFDNFTSPLQVLEQIRVNCDNIDDQNPGKEFLLGGGRINAFNTLNDSNAVAVRGTDIELIDQGDGDGRLESGETVLVRINFVNYLSPVTNVSVNIITESNYINITNASFNTGTLETLEERSNINNEFSFVIDTDATFDETIDIRLDYSQGVYQDFQWIGINLNETYNSIATSNLATTITSTGSIGYNDYPQNFQGEGLTFLRGTNILWEGAFMYGTSSEQVMDAARINSSSKSTEFAMIKPMEVVPGTFADEESYSFFNDDSAYNFIGEPGALTKQFYNLGIETELRTYSFGNPPDNNYIIFRYILTNKSGADITGLFAGIFFDIDLDETDWADDIIRYDFTDDFGYQYDSTGYPTDIYFGASLISPGDYGFYAIRNDEPGDLVNLVNNFTEEEKWRALSGGTGHSTVPVAQDVSFVVSGGPFDISNNASENIAFVIAAGEDLEDLRASILQSRTKYGNIPLSVEDDSEIIPDNFSLSQNYPNPFNPTTTIQYTIPSAGIRSIVSTKLEVYDLLGRVVATLVDETQTAGTYNVTFDAAHLPSGVYFYRLQVGSFNQTRKMILLR